jgi:hypothetical protein
MLLLLHNCSSSTVQLTFLHEPDLNTSHVGLQHRMEPQLRICMAAVVSSPHPLH